MNNNNNVINVFIPGINKTKIQAAIYLDKENITAEGILLLTFLLLLRGQYGSIIQKKKIVSPDKIPRLETAKWAAGAISKNQKIYDLACLLAVTETIQNIATISSGENISPDILKEQAIQNWEDLKKNRPEPGCRILPNGLINNGNLKSHQYGLVLQNFGRWHAISLYDPATLLKGAQLSTLDIDIFVSIFHNLKKNLDIPELEALNTKEGIIKCINDNLYNEDKIFYDEINLELNDNKLPLEISFNVKRISPAVIPEIKISEKDADNPLLKLLASNLKQQGKGKTAKKSRKKK